MNRPNKDTQSPVDHFRHGDATYEHVIYCSDDDRVECIRHDGVKILTFDSRCGIWLPDGTFYGKVKMIGNDYTWESEIEGKPTLYHKDNLKLEVLISKQYLDSL